MNIINLEPDLFINTRPDENCVWANCSSFFNFPGGEVKAKLSTNVVVEDGTPVLILARLNTSDKFFQFAQIIDILRRMDISDIRLYCPYIPYMQDDRVMTTDTAAEYVEGFGLKVFARLLNSLQLKAVYCVDPHSSVTNDAVINNLRILSAIPYVKMAAKAFKPDFLICPDEGAIHRTVKYSKALSIPYINGVKERNPLTGKIVKTYINPASLPLIEGKNVLITDDICLGGATFTSLAKALAEGKPASIGLYITHGLFTNGLPLEGINEIFCSTSMRSFSHISKSFWPFTLNLFDHDNV